jgi:VWFA-related protein
MTDRELNEMAEGPRVIAADVRSRTGAFKWSAEIRPLAAAFLLSAVTLASVSPLAQAVQKAMYVSVVDQAGAPVPDLGPSDFIVREDDVTREVVSVAPADEPMQVAVLVDTSNVAREHIPYLRDAVPTFVNTLISGPRNQVAIVGFGERPTILADYTSNSAVLKKATDLIWANPMSGPYLLDAILEISEGITKREAPRPVIVAIAAEGQELSYRHDDQVLDRLRKSGAQLYVLMLGTPYNGRNEEARSREIVISRGPDDSGGRREQVLTAIGLGSRLKLLADQLRHQYRVTYARPQTLIPPEKVTVRAKGAGRTARGALIKDSLARQ